MITLAELKRHLVIDADDDSHDDTLTELEAAAVAHVQRAAGWYIGPEQEVDIIIDGGDGGGVLWLPEKASDVSAVVSQPYEGGEQTTITAADDDGWALRLPPGETHGRRLIRKGGHGWSRGIEYVVTATIGYTAGNEPAVDREDVKALVAHWFEFRIPVSVGTIAPPVTNHVSSRIAARRRQRV